MTQNIYFIDIDATITDNKDVPQIHPDNVLGNAVLTIIRDCMVEEGWESTDAGIAIAAFADQIVFWDYPDFIEKFRLPVRKTWQRIADWHTKNLIVFEDAVEVVRKLKERGARLFIISNNPLTGCLLKLQCAELGDLGGTPFFDQCLCSNILRGQKFQNEYWQKALIHTNINPEHVIIIGDNTEEDYEVPSNVGIRQFYLINRDQQKQRQPYKNALMINDMRLVLE